MFLKYNDSDADYDLIIDGFKRVDNVITGYVSHGAWYLKIIESCIIGNTVYAYRDSDMDYLVTTRENAEYSLFEKLPHTLTNRI